MRVRLEGPLFKDFNIKRTAMHFCTAKYYLNKTKERSFFRINFDHNLRQVNEEEESLEEGAEYKITVGHQPISGQITK